MFNISQAFRNLDNVILNPLLCRYIDLIVCVCVLLIINNSLYYHCVYFCIEALC